MKKQIVIIALLAMLCLACEEDTEYMISSSDVIEVSHVDTVGLSDRLSVEVLHTGYSGCDSYSHHKIMKTDTAYNIEIYVKRPGENICSMNLIEIKTMIELTFDKPGMKTLIFKGKAREDFVDSVFVVNKK